MSLKDTINEDIKNAMRSKDQAALRALRAIKSAIILAETAEGFSGAMTQAEELKLLTSQVKQRRDSVESFIKNGRADLAKTEQEEIDVIERYLPKALTPEELKAEMEAIIAELGASGIKDLGKVMKEATPRFAGRAEGQKVSEMAKQLLG